MSGPLDSAFLSVFLLLLLAIVTMEACRRAHVASYDSPRAFLFRGRLPIHSLASNIGATFSVTYFFGAVVIYAQFFKSWIVLLLALFFPTLALIYGKIIKVIENDLPVEGWASQQGNILLELLKLRLPAQTFESLMSLFLVIYVALLAEELAVSRLIFSSIVPDNPVVVAFLLSVICLVIVVYLSYGGFRAVLIADYVQGLVLCAFFAMLGLLVIQHGTESSLISFPTSDSDIRFANLSLVAVLGLAWFLGGIDYFSRFNFDSRSPHELSEKRLRLVKVTSLLLFICLSLGILFSQALSDEIPTRIMPTRYVGLLTSFFLFKTPPIYRIIFIVSVHCMVFTTINTILVTILQISAYKPKNPLNRERLLLILLIAVFGSGLIAKDRVHTIGIFIASLFILPSFPIVRSLFPRPASGIPINVRYLWWALGGSVIIFAAIEPRIDSSFDYHFLIPGIPTALVLASLGLSKGLVMLRKGKVNDA